VEALNVPDTSFAVSVYFRTQAEAERFAASLEPPPDGVANVQVGCGD
jgi:hypothetical protein